MITTTSPVPWAEFTVAAPRIAEVFHRRHEATGHLCLLGTLRADGSPRVSPMEPKVFEDELWLVGMPGTAKFRDLLRDPRFELHTATVDTQVGDGDAKLRGTAHDVHDPDLHARLAQWLFDTMGLDVRESGFDHVFRVAISGASAVVVADGHLDVTVWRAGETERVVRKH